MLKFLGMTMLAGLVLSQPASGLAQTREPDPITVSIRLSPELLERGLHGTVKLRATVSAENKVEGATILETSGSQELDGYAQANLMGAAVAPGLINGVDRSLTVEADLYAFEVGLDLLRSYSCAQAVLDHDWYITNHPGEAFERGKFFNMFLGLAVVTGRKELAFALKADLHHQAWLEAIERCRGNGERQFSNVVIAAGNGAVTQ